MQAPHIDKTDFLNVVVREKKRFENTLDDSVAAGLNAGTEVLMNQVRKEISCVVFFYKIPNRLIILFQNLQTRENIIHLRMIRLSLVQRRVV